MTEQKEFIISIFEQAFGDNARPEEFNDEINKEDRRMAFTYEEVIEKISEYNKESYEYENLTQGSMLHDNESFIALVCSKDDIAGQIKADENQDEPTEEETKIALTMINSDYFRSKFTDTIMNDFWETIDCLYDDESIMNFIMEETIKNEQ